MPPNRYMVVPEGLEVEWTQYRRYMICRHGQRTADMFNVLAYVPQPQQREVQTRRVYYHAFDPGDIQFMECRLWPTTFVLDHQNPQQRVNPIKYNSLRDLESAIPRGYKIHPIQLTVKLHDDPDVGFVFHATDGRHRLMASRNVNFTFVPVAINWAGFNPEILGFELPAIVPYVHRSRRGSVGDVLPKTKWVLETP